MININSRTAFDHSIHRYIIYIEYLIFFTPLIDSMNGIMDLLNIILPFSFGQVTRAILLLINSMVLLKFSPTSFLGISTMFFLCLIRSLIYLILYNTDMMSDFSLDLKLMYNIQIFLIVYTLCKFNIMRYNTLIKWMKNAVVLCVVIFWISTFLNLNLTYIGTKGLFIDVNSLTVVLTLGSSLFLHSLFYEEFNLKTLFYFVLSAIPLFLLGTKSGIIALMFISLFLTLISLVKNFRIRIFVIVFLLITVLIGVTYYFRNGEGQTLTSRWLYFYNRMDFFSFLLSGRNEVLRDIFSVWKNSSSALLLGFGQSRSQLYIAGYAAARYICEMDFFDLIFLYGTPIGLVISSVMIFGFCKAFIMILNYKHYQTTLPYIVGFVLMALGGHVIFSPFAGVFLALLLVLILKPIKSQSPDAAHPELTKVGSIV